MSTCYGVKCDKLRELQRRRRLAARTAPRSPAAPGRAASTRGLRGPGQCTPPPRSPRSGDPGGPESGKAPPWLDVPFPPRPAGSSAARGAHRAPRRGRATTRAWDAVYPNRCSGIPLHLATLEPTAGTRAPPRAQPRPRAPPAPAPQSYAAATGATRPPCGAGLPTARAPPAGAQLTRIT